MIILSIPANSDTIPAVENIDLIEIRLDYLKENSFQSYLTNLRPTSKTIITIRDESEGGKFALEAEKKLNLYKEFILKWDCLVDFEYKLYIKQKHLLPPHNLILSLHSFEKFDYNEIRKFLTDASQIDCAYLKLAVNIDTYSDLTKLSELLTGYDKPVLFAGLGKLGKLSRLLHHYLKAAGTYVGLDDNLINPYQLS
ncbi:MAG: type I 3-dehydroquinate dehydratase, partial [Candidatus Cloacimonetes bacterium]|nr:type I 3-dehydroquinate dehydratase [Candidatus Cloacimonadota bacterium]